MKRYMILIIILMIIPIHFIPNVKGDIVVVPGVVISNNLININISIHENDAVVEITQNYILTSYLREEFSITLLLDNGTLIESEVTEPDKAIIEKNNTKFIIKYSTNNDSSYEKFFQYKYKIEFKNISGINFSKEIENKYSFFRDFTHFFTTIENSKTIINSNKDITSFNGSEYRYGKRVEINSFYDYTDYIKIYWRKNSKLNNISELITTNIIGEHVFNINKLIKKEFVNIDIWKMENEYKYQLNGEFILNKSLIPNYTPFYLWFPENGTNATANIYFQNYKFDEHIGIQSCQVEKSMRFDQTGFYIKIEPLEHHSFFYNDKIRKPLDFIPILEVFINGTLKNNWFDFIIVSIPIENSVINITYPSIFDIKNIQSPFEFNNFSNNSYFENQISIYGKCQKMDKIHIEWDILVDKDGDLIPDIKDEYPNDPNNLKKKDKKETGFIPGFEISLLLITILIIISVNKKKK